MSSLELSAAFDVVNTMLLLKRIKTVGLPPDIIDLIKVWLSESKYFVNINGKCSLYYELQSGTIQGFILGPFLNAIYVSPPFNMSNLSTFADDNHILRWNSSLI
jgi:hypothetical protein